jgi:hypothetical protein
VIGEPPSDAGGVNDTVAELLPGVAVPIVGAPGTTVAVVDMRLAATPPTVTVVVVGVTGDALDACWRHTYWLGRIVPAAVPNAATSHAQEFVLETQYDPAPDTVTSARVLIFVMKAGAEVIGVERAVPVCAANEYACGAVTSGRVLTN